MFITSISSSSHYIYHYSHYQSTDNLSRCSFRKLHYYIIVARSPTGNLHKTSIMADVSDFPQILKLVPTKPRIAITMGSDSDLPVLKPGMELLESLEIPFHVTITSAHRTPHLMMKFASSAAQNGFSVIIAAAGGAAHLPGMIAACTPLPVIGVPVKGSTLDGMDSLLSMVQMPRGVPVATVAINNSVNAALLAARIIGTSDEAVRHKLVKYSDKMSKEVEEKSSRLSEVGFQNY